MSIMNVPQIFQNDDTVYHYTTSKNALSYILKDMKLRLSPRSKSIDPIENTKDWISNSGDINDNLIRIGKKINTELDKAKQLSFCKNKTYDSRNGIPTLYPLEKYGFAKPRMWDNYGDKYKGVCIAFSKSKLQDVIKNTLLFNKNVEYINYNDFEVKHHGISWKDSDKNTFDYFLDYFKNRLFYKHEDYNMENEYRICSLSDEPYDYIDIRDCIVGLIISNKGKNEYLYDKFARLLNNRDNLPFLILSFGSNGLRIKTYQEQKKLRNSIESSIKKK